MVEVTYYNSYGREVGRSVYASRLLAWRMVAWRQRIEPGIRVSVRNLGKGE
jgi:hypothetical protein